MKICFPALLMTIVFLSMFSFFVSAETTEPESFSIEESSSYSLETSNVPVSEDSSDVSSTFDEQEAIINRLDLIYTLGLFFVAILVALLVLFILWRVLDVFI